MHNDLPVQERIFLTVAHRSIDAMSVVIPNSLQSMLEKELFEIFASHLSSHRG